MPDRFTSYVYGVRFFKPGHPESGKIRYIGKTVNPERRFRRHRAAEGNGKLQRSVRRHGEECFTFEILLIVETDSQHLSEKLSYDEEIRLIRLMGTAEARGLNMTLGGDGFLLTDETRSRHAEISRTVLAEVKSRPDVRAKYSQIATERHAKNPDNLHSEKSIEKRAKTLRDKYRSDPAFYEKRKAILDAARSSPKFIPATRERLIKMNKDPEVRARMAASLKVFNTDDVRREKAERAKAQHQDHYFRQKYDEGLRRKHSDPEYAAKHAAHTKSRHANPAFGRIAKMGIHLHWAKKHLDDGKVDAAHKQINSLRLLLSQCGTGADEARMVSATNQFLSIFEVSA